MNKKIIITVLLAVVSLSGSAQLESVKELSMKSEYFNHERQVLIYTPGGYQQYDHTFYDVIYVFDAQDRTMFDLVHCLLNITCKPDPDGGRTMNFIIVGICSPNLRLGLLGPHAGLFERSLLLSYSDDVALET